MISISLKQIKLDFLNKNKMNPVFEGKLRGILLRP